MKTPFSCTNVTFLSLLSLSLIFIPPTLLACSDTTQGPFQLGNGTTQYCINAKKNPKLCRITEVQQNCQYTCTKCCKDKKGTFKSAYPDLDLNTKKRCSMVKMNPGLCNKSIRWRNNCAKSCGTCPCFDNPGEFILQERKKNDLDVATTTTTTNSTTSNNNTLTCHYVAMNRKKRCQKRLFRNNCPHTCNLCPNTVVNLMSRCEIDAKLSYPSFNDAEYYGYSSDFVTVIKRGHEHESCGHEQRETSWGCSHNGTARIFKLNEALYYSYRESEYVHIADATNSSFDFVIQHYFSDNELYYEGDEHMAGILAIKVTTGQLKSFSRPRNKNQDTHNEYGSINEEYIDSARVRATCDHECRCQMKKIARRKDTAVQ